MAYTVTERCIQCSGCLPLCPTGAIQIQNDQVVIDADLCNSCQGYYPEPQCVIACPVNSPIPIQAKKGRCKIEVRPLTSFDLFLNGKTNSFASAIVMWELCNILSQRRSLPWKTDDSGDFFYLRHVSRGQGKIVFRVTDPFNPDPTDLKASGASEIVEGFDIRAACMNLIYAAHATTLDRPWEQEFLISDQQIEKYLGLDKRRDLCKADKLTLIKDLAQQPCKIQVSVDLPRKGLVNGVSLEASPLWHIQEVQHYFQEDQSGCKHLVGLLFRVKAGQWAEYFLNEQGYWNRQAFYQYGCLPKSLLTEVMSIWQQHEGAARMMLWLLFKTKMGEEQRITVTTLMRIAYGEERLAQAASYQRVRKRLLRTFESDLEVLSNYGLKPVFDPVTYPIEIQPLWAKLGAIPDDAEAALEFWTQDGSQNKRLTDAAPRGKWNRLMNARLLCFELPEDWDQPSNRSSTKKRTTTTQKRSPTSSTRRKRLSGEDIVAARKRLKLSQRALAEQVGKSQSWVRDVENGRFQASTKDQTLLRETLKL